MAHKVYVGVIVSSILGDERCWVQHRLNDETVQAMCMYLTRQGRVEEAEMLLERYCESGTRHALTYELGESNFSP